MTESQNDDKQARFSCGDNILENELEQPYLMAVKNVVALNILIY